MILNHCSGAVSRGQRACDAASLGEAFRRHGIYAKIQSVPGHAVAAAARRVLSEGADALVVGGGDGSISGAAAVLAGSQLPLGVLPLGTYNHFARDLNLPQDLPSAIRVIAEGNVTAVDTAEVNGHVFVNNSSIGAYPRAVAEREALRARNGLNKKAAMVWAAARVLWRRPMVHTLLEFSSEKVERKTPFVFVGNNHYALGADATARGELRSSLSSGCLCVFAARCAGFWCIGRLAWRALRNRLLSSEEFAVWNAREVRIHTRKRHIRVALDGEVTRLTSPLHYRIRPRTLRVITPASP